MGGSGGGSDALLEPCEGSVPSTLGARGWKRSRSAFACCDREQAAVHLEGSGDPGEDGQRARPFWSLSSPGPVRAPAGRSLSAQRQLPAWAWTRRWSPRATARGLPSASTPASCGLRPLSLQAPPPPQVEARHTSPMCGSQEPRPGALPQSHGSGPRSSVRCPANNTCAPPHPGSRVRVSVEAGVTPVSPGACRVLDVVCMAQGRGLALAFVASSLLSPVS